MTAHFERTPRINEDQPEKRCTEPALFERKLEPADLVWGCWKVRQGWTKKRIAVVLGVSRWTLWRHLVAFRGERAESVGTSVVLAALVGSHRVHAAHAIMDLWELVHVVVGEGRPPTMRDLARIRGEWDGGAYKPQDEASAVRAFYRIKEVLDAQGVRFTKHAVEGLSSIRIDFDVKELAEFVRREIPFAGRVIEGYAARTGSTRRFRGR